MKNDVSKVLSRLNVSSICKDWKDDVKVMDHLYDHSIDIAHKQDHIKDVMDRSKNLIRNHSMFMGLSEIDKHEFVEDLRLAVLFHDCGAEVNRKMHHVIGADVFREIAKSQGGLTDARIHKIALAIEEHRGSYDGEFSSFLSEVLSAADRGNPDSLEYTVIRSYEYAKTNQSKVHSEATTHALEHVKDKYGSNGYARYSKIYLDFYSKELNKFKKAVDSLTIEQVETMVGDSNA